MAPIKLCMTIPCIHCGRTDYHAFVELKAEGEETLQRVCWTCLHELYKKVPDEEERKRA